MFFMLHLLLFRFQVIILLNKDHPGYYLTYSGFFYLVSSMVRNLLSRLLASCTLVRVGFFSPGLPVFGVFLNQKLFDGTIWPLHMTIPAKSVPLQKDVKIQQFQFV